MSPQLTTMCLGIHASHRRCLWGSSILRFGHQCLVCFYDLVQADEVFLLVHGRYLLNVFLSFALYVELQLFCVRYGVWGPPACKGWGSETQLVGVFNIMHFVLAATCSFQIGSVHDTGGDWLVCPQLLSQTSWGGLFSVFRLNHQLLGLLRLEIGIIEEEAFGEV